MRKLTRHHKSSSLCKNCRKHLGFRRVHTLMCYPIFRLIFSSKRTETLRQNKGDVWCDSVTATAKDLTSMCWTTVLYPPTGTTATVARPNSNVRNICFTHTTQDTRSLDICKQMDYFQAKIQDHIFFQAITVNLDSSCKRVHCRMPYSFRTM